MDEHRVVLTNEEAFKLSRELEFVDSGYIRDEYTGERRIRIQEGGEVEDKEYKTPVTGTVVRFSGKCRYKGIDDVFFEIRWTKDKVRFEIEFEGEVPDEFKDRPNVRGWQILEND